MVDLAARRKKITSLSGKNYCVDHFNYVIAHHMFQILYEESIIGGLPITF